MLKYIEVSGVMLLRSGRGSRLLFAIICSAELSKYGNFLDCQREGHFYSSIPPRAL